MNRNIDRETRLAIVSDNLRKLRERMYPDHGGKKLLASDMNLTIQQWSPWEKGARIPSDIRLEKIADFFHVPVDFLWTDHRGLRLNDFVDMLEEFLSGNIELDKTIAAPKFAQSVTVSPSAEGNASISPPSTTEDMSVAASKLGEIQETSLSKTPGESLRSAVQNQIKTALAMEKVKAKANLEFEFSITDIVFLK